MTFSIVARCAQTGMLGIAVSSSSPAVAARCAYARAHVGAVGSQNITAPTLGPRLLDLMAHGATAPEAVRIVAGSAAHITFRQLLAVGARLDGGQDLLHRRMLPIGRKAVPNSRGERGRA